MAGAFSLEHSSACLLQRAQVPLGLTGSVLCLLVERRDRTECLVRRMRTNDTSSAPNSARKRSKGGWKSNNSRENFSDCFIKIVQYVDSKTLHTAVEEGIAPFLWLLSPNPDPDPDPDPDPNPDPDADPDPDKATRFSHEG